MYTAKINKMSEKNNHNQHVEDEPVDENEVFQKHAKTRKYWTESDLLDYLETVSEVKNKYDEETVRTLFNLFDQNKDDRLDEVEFSRAWRTCLLPMLRPVSGLIVVDVQNDFTTGSLALHDCPAKQDGVAVIPVINSLLSHNHFDVVVYTYDWHPSDHISFLPNVSIRTWQRSSNHGKENGVKELRIGDTVTFHTKYGPTEQTLWPVHCVQGSHGAALHPKLKVVEQAMHVHKGTHPDVDSYSAFYDNNRINKTDLHDNLQARRVTDVFVCGLATDFCVFHTTNHSLEHGYRTVLVEDACRGVSEAGIQSSLEHLRKNHAYVATAQEVPALLQGKKRPLCLLLSSALFEYSKSTTSPVV